jgi:predicted ribosomally synthesized peptide with SipW-like signal peptide
MRRIFYSATILLFVGVLAVGATGAFFSDTQTSSGNTFSAGDLQLKVDDTQHYANLVCAQVTQGVFQWTQDPATTTPTTRPDLLGTPCDGTWALTTLGPSNKFFDFSDLKPGDQGEDTASLHTSNNAWACLNIGLNANNDNGATGPEAQAEIAAGIDPTQNGPNDGRLAQNMTLFVWRDNGTTSGAMPGDNIYEPQGGDSPLVASPVLLSSFSPTTTITLADSTTGSPLIASTTNYIGIAWCLGSTTVNNTTGQITCDGSVVTNIVQTDSATSTVQFNVVQSRNNSSFTCGGGPRSASLKVTKIVVNNNGGNKTVSNFTLFVDNGTVTQQVTSGSTTPLSPGNYRVEEAGSSGYQATFSGDCNIEGNVTLAPGDNKSCTLTNTELPAHITLIKQVTGNAAPPSSFSMRVDGTLVPTGTSFAVTSNTPHTITEDAKSGFHFVSITGSPECPAALGGTATLSEGEAITCTITNAANP